MEEAYIFCEYSTTNQIRTSLSKSQIVAAAKIARDLDRYERSRKKAARMIGAQKKELCYLASQIELLEYNYKNAVTEYGKKIQETDKLKEQISDLSAYLTDSQETVMHMNDEDNTQRGIIRAYENVIDKLIQK